MRLLSIRSAQLCEDGCPAQMPASQVPQAAPNSRVPSSTLAAVKRLANPIHAVFVFQFDLCGHRDQYVRALVKAPWAAGKRLWLHCLPCAAASHAAHSTTLCHPSHFDPCISAKMPHLRCISSIFQHASAPPSPCCSMALAQSTGAPRPPIPCPPPLVDCSSSNVQPLLPQHPLPLHPLPCQMRAPACQYCPAVHQRMLDLLCKKIHVVGLYCCLAKSGKRCRVAQGALRLHCVQDGWHIAFQRLGLGEQRAWRMQEDYKSEAQRGQSPLDDDKLMKDGCGWPRTAARR